MVNNRELLAREIVDRFVASISGTHLDKIVKYDPNDRIYVGKLSPQSTEEAFSSSVLIKQIGVNFRVPKTDIETVKLDIFPQGNFFFRILPTYEEQKQAFLKDFLGTFTDQKILSFDELVSRRQKGQLTKEMLEHKVQLLPVYKKISIDRLYDLFNYKPKSVATYGADSTDDIKGVLEFNHIFTSYGDNKVLKDVSFVIKPKELTAIVGRSGSGKSTILNHILRLYTPDSGVISIDGKDIFSYQDDVYKTNVSVVTQKSFLFQMSIRDNLNLVDSNFSRQQEVCKELGIHDEILSLPKGYQTILEENASNVSTRLKQLLSIARSILTNSEILLFDEITSSLDSDTTKQVVKVFKKLSKTHTVILITHKREVMDAADHLIIISKGRKVADGTPSDLKDNFYYNDLKNSKSFDHSYE